jgi:thiosulfate reductase/polysulfide reductase chain A
MKGLCAAYAVGALPPGALALQKDSQNVTGLRDVTYSTCEMCSFRCPIKVHTGKGKVFIEGNQNVAGQRNRVCGRGGSGYSQLLDPKRIVKPMKRSGPRGAGTWEVISWETAYTEISAKMKEISAKYGGPETFAFSAKSGAMTPHFFQLAKVFGSPNTFSHLSTCPGGRYVTADIIMGFNPGADVENTKYLIHFGHNLYEGIEVADTFAFMEMQARGGKVVSFDPRLSVASSKADEYFLIKPGTDGAVALALCNVLIEENLYDKDFIDKYVNGFDEFAAAVRSITPEFAEEHSGVPAADIRRIARELAAAAPAAIVSPGHRTTYSLEEFDLRRAMFALNFLVGNYEKKGGLITGKGPGAYNQLAREAVMPDFPGMSVADDPWDPPARPRIDSVNPLYRYMSKSGGVYQSIFDSALTGEPYPIKGWFMQRSNPLQTVAELPKMVKATEGMELIVCCDIYMTESASYADYFLPECTYLERGEDLSVNPGLSPSVFMRQPAVAIIGDTKPGWMIWKELATHLGLEEYYYWEDMEERQFIETDEQEHLYKALKEAGALSYGIPVYLRDKENAAEFVAKYPNAAENLTEEGDFSEFIIFGTPSNKIELCPEILDEIAPGYRLPRFQNLPLRDNEDQLFFIQGKVAVHTNAGTASVPNLSYHMPENPLWMHPDLAAKIGVKTGDMVQITSSVGTEKGKVAVTRGIRSDTVFTYMAGSGRKTGDLSQPAAANGINCANLLKMHINDVTGMVVHTCGVTVTKA